VNPRAGLGAVAKKSIYVGFEVLSTVTTKSAFFWDVSPCNLERGLRIGADMLFRNIRQSPNPEDLRLQKYIYSYTPAMN
jgi:hypothetical protein